MEALLRILSWLLKKLTFGVLLLVLAVAVLALRAFVRDRGDFDLRRNETLRALTGEVKKLEAVLADVEARMADLGVQISAAEARAVESRRLAVEIADQTGGMKRLTMDAAQLKENDARVARLKQMEADSKARIVELRERLTRTQWEKDGLEIALGRMRGQVAAVEAQKSKVEHYARTAWEKYGRQVLALVAVYFLGPILWRLLAFFLLAPLISGRAPVRVGPAGAPLPEINTSRAALDMTLRPGDTLWVKEKFLQASDEQLARKTRTLLDWRIPLTCAAAGLTELIEMKNGTGGDLRATFSSQQDAHMELGLVSLPEGATMIVRPRFLAGLVGTGGGKMRIRRHWRLLHLQSWVTGQFRHFEFVGPGHLLLAAGRGVRAEKLEAAGEQPTPARRVNREATIGFTPGLDYRPVRAETFWAYLRGMSPLFDDLFEGKGVFLCQETSARSPFEQKRGAGERLWDGFLRIFGV